MKKLIMMIVCLGLLVLPLSVSADCEHFCDDLAGQCFITTVNETEFELCFSLSPFGPCPSGVATLEYIDVQIIDEISYEAIISEDFFYSTSDTGIIIADLKFILLENFLIYVPEDVLVFNRIIEE